MAKTARDIITSSLRKLGVVASGETPAAEELQDGLSALQRMLDSWSAGDLLPFPETQETFTLTPGKAEYTFGPGGDFDSVRPMDIVGISVIPSGSLEIPLTKLKFDQWRLIALKTVSATFPTEFYFRLAWPKATAFFFPTPTEAKQIIVYSQKPFAAVTSLTSDIDFPPGFEEAIVYNLCLALADEFGQAVTPLIAQKAATLLDTIRTANLARSVPYLASGSEYRGHEHAGWNLADFLKGGG